LPDAVPSDAGVGIVGSEFSELGVAAGLGTADRVTFGTGLVGAETGPGTADRVTFGTGLVGAETGPVPPTDARDDIVEAGAGTSFGPGILLTIGVGGIGWLITLPPTA